jgi:integrase-like protein
MARDTGGSTIGSPASGAPLPWASIRRSPLRAPANAARKRESSWPNTLIRVRKEGDKTCCEDREWEYLRGDRTGMAFYTAQATSSKVPRANSRSIGRGYFPSNWRARYRKIDAPELLEVLRKVERRGVIETARRLRQKNQRQPPLQKARPCQEQEHSR